MHRPLFLLDNTQIGIVQKFVKELPLFLFLGLVLFFPSRLKSLPLFYRLFTKGRIRDCLYHRLVFVEVGKTENTADLEHIAVRFLDDFRQVIDVDFPLLSRLTEEPRQGGGFDIVNGILKFVRVVQVAEIAERSVEADGRKDRNAILRNERLFTKEVKSGGKTARTAGKSADKVNMFRFGLSVVVHVLVVDDESPLIEKEVGRILEIQKDTAFRLLPRKIDDHLNDFRELIKIHR